MSSCLEGGSNGWKDVNGKKMMNSNYIGVQNGEDATKLQCYFHQRLLLVSLFEFSNCKKEVNETCMYDV
jgi:hypothetical protein